MKNIILILFALHCLFSFAQNEQAQQEVLRKRFQEPQALSPSPDLRNMLQFTQTPVSEYTGIPDVKIPLYTFLCTKNLDFNLNLKYHPNAVKKEERAGSTGLGWSLFAGGSITRVVKGLPDETNTTSMQNIPLKGLHTPINAFLGNDFDNFLNNSSYVFPASRNLYDKLYESIESGVFDTSYDIYYYDFMGYSGSFYLKMSDDLNSLSVVKLDNSNVKITVQFTKYPSSDSYEINSFTLYDENGNKYFFNIKENTRKIAGYKAIPMFESKDVWENVNFDMQGGVFNDQQEYFTAFHLTNVTPYTYSQPLIEFTYNTYKESYKDQSIVLNELINHNSNNNFLTDVGFRSLVQSNILAATSYGYSGIRWQFGMRTTYNTTLYTTDTKKVARINYNDKLYINFTYETGRTDGNYFLNQDLVKLSNIEILSADPPLSIIRPSLRNTKLIKQFKFNYSQTAYGDKKLLLKEVIEYKNTINDELVSKYLLSYAKENQNPGTIYEDKWGFVTSLENRNTDANLISTYVLEKMSLPTGGCIIYNYEPHTYSYIGATPLYTTVLPISRKNETGGGIRIKNIGYFDDKDVPQNYYAQSLTVPAASKEIFYDYNENTSLSTGSLTFPIPVFEYTRYQDLFGEYFVYQGNNTIGMFPLQPNTPNPGIFKFKTKTDYNNLLSLTTQGSNVGYKKVIITERNNGKKELTFTSPIDFPEENYTTSYPFMPSKNSDYKRGLPLNEKNYNSENFLVSEVINTYNYTENEVNMGIIPFYRNGYNCRKTICDPTPYKRSDRIASNIASCHLGTGGNVLPPPPSSYYQDLPYCNSTEELMDYKIEKRIVGWATLSRSERIDYLPDAVNNVTEYTYNSTNKKPSSVKSIIGNDVYSTNYDYLNTGSGGLVFNNLSNRISDVSKLTRKINNEILSTEQIIFKDINPNNTGGIISAGSEIYVPEKYQYAKGSNTLENLKTITRLDDRGNPLEIKNPDGTYTSFIWGHNKTRLIAVVANCQLSEIETLAAYPMIISATNNNLTAGVHTTLLNNYNTFRTSLPAKAQMTALIHDIGLGIVTKIDPNGKIISYTYNTLGNLQEIRDNENNLLKQYFEFYKN